MKKKFAFTIGTIKEVCERCPDHDLDRLGELFSGNDYPKTIDNMAWFISTLNRWAVFKETRSFDGAMTVDDVMVMDMPEVMALFDEAMAAFNKDKQPETEIVQKKEKAAQNGKS